MTWTPVDPLEIDPGRLAGDASGTPVALLELVRRRGDLVLVDAVAEEDVALEFPFGEEWRRQTGAQRFVRLRPGAPYGATYAVVRS